LGPQFQDGQPVYEIPDVLDDQATDKPLQSPLRAIALLSPIRRFGARKAALRSRTRNPVGADCGTCR